MPDIIELTLPVSDRTDPQLEFNNRSGGVGLDGVEQILSPLSERWRYQAVIPIHREAQARAIRSVKSRLKGRLNFLLVRLCDQYRLTKRDLGDLSDNVTPIPFSDGALFSDGSGFAPTTANALVTVGAGENSETLTIRASDMGGAIVSGVFFSVNYWLHQIDDWVVDGSNYVLTISPPLRQLVTAGTLINLDAESLWQLADDDQGRLDLQIGRFGAVTLALVEPIGRRPV